MKLGMLVYLLDWLALARRGMPVADGIYVSLPNGPIIRELSEHQKPLVAVRQNHGQAK